MQDIKTGKLHPIRPDEVDLHPRVTFSVGEAVVVKGGRFRITEIDRDGLRLEGVPFERKVGRNEPCPCGGGKKYKKCCMLTHEHDDE